MSTSSDLKESLKNKFSEAMRKSKLLDKLYNEMYNNRNELEKKYYNVIKDIEDFDANRILNNSIPYDISEQTNLKTVEDIAREINDILDNLEKKYDKVIRMDEWFFENDLTIGSAPEEYDFNFDDAKIKIKYIEKLEKELDNTKDEKNRNILMNEIDDLRIDAEELIEEEIRTRLIDCEDTIDYYTSELGNYIGFLKYSNDEYKELKNKFINEFLILEKSDVVKNYLKEDEEYDGEDYKIFKQFKEEFKNR